MLINYVKLPWLAAKPLLLIVLSMLNAASQAQETETASWHQIEYIIFQHLKTDAHVLRYEDTPYPRHQHKQFSYLIKNSQPMSPSQYTKLDKSQMQLADALNRLSNRRDIKVLDHGAWQQELSGEAQYAPLKITKQFDNKRSLFGELQLRKSRFTHAEFSLYLADSVPFAFADSKYWFLSAQPAGSLLNFLLPLPKDSTFTPLTGTQELYFNISHLQESRRIKQGEIHYLDHPIIGVIVTINAIETPAYAFLYSPINANER